MLGLLTPTQTTPKMGDQAQKVKKLRSTRACVSCRIRKIRCDAQERIPCSNCAPLGSTCKFVEPKSRKKKTRMVAPTPPTPPMQWPPPQGGYYTSNPYQFYGGYPVAMAPQRVSPMGQHSSTQISSPYQQHYVGQTSTLLTPQQQHLLQGLQLPAVTFPLTSFSLNLLLSQSLHLLAAPAPGNVAQVSPLQGVQTQLQQPFQAQPQLYQPQQLLYPMHPPLSTGGGGYQMPPPVHYFAPHPYYYTPGVSLTTPPKPTPYLTPLDSRVVQLPQFPSYLSPMVHQPPKDDKK